MTATEITIKGFKYTVETTETTEQMRNRGLVRTATDMEKRGLLEMLIVRKPKGTKLFTAYRGRSGNYFL